MVELCEVRMEILLQYTRAARNERSCRVSREDEERRHLPGGKPHGKCTVAGKEPTNDGRLEELQLSRLVRSF